MLTYFRYFRFSKFKKHWIKSAPINLQDEDDYSELGGILFFTRALSVFLPILASLLFSYWLSAINTGLKGFRAFLGVTFSSKLGQQGILEGLYFYDPHWKTILFVLFLLLTAFTILIHLRLDDRMDMLRLKKIVQLSDRAPSTEVIRKIESPIQDLTNEVDKVKSIFSCVRQDSLSKERIKELDEQFSKFFGKQLELLKTVTRTYFKLHKTPFRLRLMFFIEETESAAINYLLDSPAKKTLIIYPQYSTKNRMGYFLNRHCLSSSVSSYERHKMPEDENMDIAIMFSATKEEVIEEGIYKLWHNGYTYTPTTNNLKDFYYDQEKNNKTQKYFGNLYNNINSFASIRIDRNLNSESFVIGALNIESPTESFLGKDQIELLTYNGIMRLILSISREIHADYQVFLNKHLLTSKNSDILT